MLVEKKMLGETGFEIVSLWAIHDVIQEETSLVDSELINNVYVLNHVKTSVKLCPWKKGFILGVTLSV
mgnify:CR=1 FL=1|jgi:hypothetical protein